MKTLTHDRLTKLANEAKASERFRMNYNMHSELTDPVQRLAIDRQPTSGLTGTPGPGNY